MTTQDNSPGRDGPPDPARAHGDFSARLVHCASVREAWSLLVGHMAAYGFDRILFGMNGIDADGGLAGMGDALVLIEGEPGYIDRYLDECLYLDSPAVEWAMRNRGALGWGALMGAAEQSPGPLTRRLLALNLEYGLCAGYTVSLADPATPEVAMIGLGARAGIGQAQVDALWARDGDALELACHLFYLRILALPRPGALQPLTSRQLQALAWYGAGKTCRDIAQIMDIRSVTVEDHLKKAREALDAVTTAQAVKKATRLNLI